MRGILPRTTLAILALLTAGGARAADPAPPAKTRVPIVLQAPKDIREAVRAVALATDAETEKLEGVAVDEGRSFSMTPAAAERLLEGSHATFKKAGFYLFRYERSYGVAGDKDRVGLLRTTDRSVVIRRMGTAAPRLHLTPALIVAWLDSLAKEEPFELWEIGTDYVAGRFERTPKDPVAIAKRCAEVSPELVAGRTPNLHLLANEIRDNRTLLLIW